MMFEKGKRAQRQSEDDKVFNRMLIWLAGAVVVELLLFLLQKAYVEIIFDVAIASALSMFFRVFSIAGAVIAVGCLVWAVINYRGNKPVTVPVIIAAVAAVLWVISLLSYFLYAEGIRILMLFPAAAAVLIIIFFLYQRPFFLNALLTGGGLLALWLHRQYYMTHPRAITACIIAGVVVLALAAVLAFQLRKTDGKLFGIRVMPVESNYMMTWITCAVVAVAMVAALILGTTAAYYLLFVLVAWLFAQAVFFTVKMM